MAGRKDRARVSKKHKKKKTDAVCLTCGKGLHRKWRACPRCGRESFAHRSARKAAAPTPFIGKAGRAKCVKCMTVARRRGQARRTTCGSALLYSVKAAPSPVGDLITKAASSPDPVEREYYWRFAHPDNGGGVA